MEFDVADKADALLVMIGEAQPDLGNRARLRCENVLRSLELPNQASLNFFLKELSDTQLLEESNADASGGEIKARLSFKGWMRFRELKKGTIERCRGFMAMPFGNPLLDQNFSDHWKPASEEVGLPLFRLDEQPKAGSITQRMKQEIRQSKYLVAELTERNPGVYWEGGFAEGLGKPVIFLCEKSFFENRDFDGLKGVHFDVNQMQAILWETREIEKAVEDLKATIRNTFPEDTQI